MIKDFALRSILECELMYGFERNTAKTIIDSNCALVKLEPVVENFLRHDLMFSRTEHVRDRPISDQFYKTHLKEHGFYGYENGDFALNFSAPFLLECGFSIPRIVLEQYLVKSLHPSEDIYLRNYIRKYFDWPKPLTESCRDVLRKHFSGRKLYRFTETTECPQKIKDFILMKYIFQNQELSEK